MQPSSARCRSPYSARNSHPRLARCRRLLNRRLRSPRVSSSIGPAFPHAPRCVPLDPGARLERAAPKYSLQSAMPRAPRCGQQSAPAMPMQSVVASSLRFRVEKDRALCRRAPARCRIHPIRFETCLADPAASCEPFRVLVTARPTANLLEVLGSLSGCDLSGSHLRCPCRQRPPLASGLVLMVCSQRRPCRRRLSLRGRSRQRRRSGRGAARPVVVVTQRVVLRAGPPGRSLGLHVLQLRS